VEEHERGRDAFESDEEYELHRLRHSAAHVMAQAVKELRPDARFAIGPAIKDGFYYDIAVATPFTDEDLEKIEELMKKISKENQPFERDSWTKEQARAWFGARGENFKLELIDGITDETVSIYRNPSKDPTKDPFVDLCAGPHVARTGNVKHFKLLKTSGAFWRADAKNEQLQRIYGTVWKTREDLDRYLYVLEEAKKRDHRKLGRELDLFMFHDWAPGAAIWLPRGEDLYNTLATRMRALLHTEGYMVVKTPLIFDQKLWETSGHWFHYRDNMFHFPERSAGSEGEETERNLGLKAMNCPCHMLIFGSRKRSYRELPIRIHDQGVLHRNELSGALSGLTRVRQFAQDDGHLFCTEDQIADEVTKLLQLIDRVYAAFDLTYTCKLSTRPAERMGSDELWDKAEDALRNALVAAGKEFGMNEGDGAFYGPKIDFTVVDALGRYHQCATVQLDFQNPLRFNLTYVGADNHPHNPVVIHRAIFGSFERFIALLIEHFAGNFPVWLAPEQVRVLTVSEKSVAHGAHVTAELKKAGIKVEFDDSSEKITYKIREGHSKRPPFMVIVGEREQAEGTVAVRARGLTELATLSGRTDVLGLTGDEARKELDRPYPMALADFVAKVAEQARIPF
jgi:threonyl-tRNA synthetase